MNNPGPTQERGFMPLDVLYWITFSIVVVDLGNLNVMRYGDRQYFLAEGVRRTIMKVRYDLTHFFHHGLGYNLLDFLHHHYAGGKSDYRSNT